MIHVSAHSFTTALHRKVRTADVGLLYDPARPGEVRLAAKWKVALAHAALELRVRRNCPYASTDDGSCRTCGPDFGRMLMSASKSR